jgi:hypothetical protein
MPFLKPSSRTLALIASVLVLSLSAGYIALAWTEPTGTMPVTVAVPLNTGNVAQTKSGALAIQGNLTAPIFYDADNTAYYVNPAGQTVLGGDIQLAGNIVKTTGYLYLSGQNGNVFIRGTGTNQGIRLDGTSQFIQAYAPVTGLESTLSLNPNGGFIGIGNSSPTELLSIGNSSSNSLNTRQGAYTYLGSDYSAWTTVLGQNVRARRGTNVGMELGSSYLGSGASAVRMNWNNIEFHAASATDIASLSEGSVFNFPKMTIQSDGKIVINNGGQLCIGTACANSATWNSIVSGASGGGTGISSNFFVIPTTGFSACDYNDGCGSSIDISFDPSSNRLVAMSYGSYGDGHNRAIVDMDDLSVRNDSYNYAWALWSGACVGNWCCNIDNLSMDNFDASGALIYCQNLSSGATVNWCPDNDPWCTSYPLLGSSAISNWNDPLTLRSDGTYLYAIYSNNYYIWKISLDSMTIVERGSGVTLPSVNGIALRNLGVNFPYKNKIYEAKFLPYYSRGFDNIGRGTNYISGYSSLWIHEIGSY